MRVGIISFNKHTTHLNYGAVLHSYAFQVYLRKYNIDSVIIDYVPKSIESYNIKYPILNNRNIWKLKPFISSFLRWSIRFIPHLIKYNKFERFFSRHYIFTDKKYRQEDLLKRGALDKYNITTFVCESDVIWKINSTGGYFDEIFFLSFPDAYMKEKIAYSPTLGSKPFNDVEEKRFKEFVYDYKAISTREHQGAEYLTKILNKKIDWVLDPTLLLRENDYEEIIIEPKEKDYLLVYNCIHNDTKMLKQASLLAKKMNLQLIEISIFSENKLFFKHMLKDSIGINEFLGYFKKASFIVCNSFHGLCFSVIFQKDFYLFLRDSTDYRMKNLTDALGLSDRLIHFDKKEIPNNLEKVNFSDVNNKLEFLRTKSYKFIHDNIIQR